MGLFSSLFGSGQPSDECKFETLRDDGVRAMQMGELPYAEKCLVAARALRSDSRVTALLAEVYLRQRRFEAALPLLEAYLRDEPNNLHALLLMAQAQGETGDYAGEQQTCERMKALQPDEPAVLYCCGEAEHGLGNDLAAIACLTQCLALKEDFAQARLLRARVLQDMGQHAEVLADAEALVALDPEEETYRMLHAQTCAALGRTDEAVADCEAVRAQNPFAQEAVLLLGALYEQATQWDKALALYDEAIDLQPDFAAAYKARGGVKHHLKDEAGAAEDLKQALTLAPEKAAEIDGSYTNVENEMNARYRQMNPYGF